MPVFGKSLFETVLESMGQDEAEVPVDFAVRRPRVVSHFLTDTAFGERPDETPFGGLYDDFFEATGEVGGPDALPVTPDWLERLTEGEVSSDLGLSSGMTSAEIRDRRRAFARSNHPDMVLPVYREAATIRMTIANRLVEAALRGRQ